MVLLLACYSARWAEPAADTQGAPVVDVDEDGFAADEDCDDGNAEVYPGSHTLEVPFDGEDVDCDGLDACVDFTCDRYDDVAVSVVCASTDLDRCKDRVYATSLYRGSPDGLAELVALPTDDPRASAAVDLNGDGYLDLVLAQAAAGTIVYWGTDEGPDPGLAAVLPGAGPTALATGDLDQDGLGDLVVVLPDAVVAWLGSPDRAPTRLELRVESAVDVAVADFDGDGLVDAAFAGDEASVLWGGDLDTPAVPLGRGAFEGVDAGDLDCDGFADLALSPGLAGGAPGEGNLLVYGASTRRFERDAFVEVEGAVATGFADLDRDGLLDLAFANTWRDEGGEAMAASSSVVLWGPLDSGSTTRFAVQAATGIAFADIDADGWTDLVYASSSSPGAPWHAIAPRGESGNSLSPYPTAAVLAVPGARAWCSP